MLTAHRNDRAGVRGRKGQSEGIQEAPLLQKHHLPAQFSPGCAVPTAEDVQPAARKILQRCLPASCHRDDIGDTAKTEIEVMGFVFL